MQMELERLWMLGCTTWLSPRKMPSAKINTARMMVSAGKRGNGRQLNHSEMAQVPKNASSESSLTVRSGNAQFCVSGPRLAPQVH